jgi:cytochrome c6
LRSAQDTLTPLYRLENVLRLSIKHCNGSQLAALHAMRTLTYATIATLLASSVFGQSSKGSNGPGAEVFREQCIGCHGPDGRAQTETGKKVGAADLTSDSVQKETNSSLSKIVQDGKGKMPAFEGRLSDDEIRAVVAYVRELARKAADHVRW